MTSTFGFRFRAAMKASGMTAADLARLCGVSRYAVGKWLKMAEARLAAVHLFCIADAMDVSPRRLATGHGRTASQKRASK